MSNLTFSDLPGRILSTGKPHSQKDAVVRSTLLSRLQMITDRFGDVINTDSDMLEILSAKRFILSTTGLMTEIESWFTEFLLLWEYMYRVYNPGHRDLALHIYDECQHRLFSSEKERKVQKIGSSAISQLVDECRAMNIGICSLSQEPSSILNAVINNSYLKIAFHLGSGSEIHVVKEAMGLNNEQAEMLHYLDVGEAIVRMAGGFMSPFPVKFDDFNDSSYCGEDQFWLHQREMKERLYKESLAKHVSRVKQSVGTTSDAETCSNEHPAMAPTPLASKHQVTQSSEGTVKYPDYLLSLLQVWLNLIEVFLIQGALFRKVGIKSGSAQTRIKKELIRLGFVIEHSIQTGKTFSSVWEPTDKAYEYVGLQKRVFPSKGGYLHQFCAHHVVDWGKSRGYKAQTEFFLATNKAVDVVLSKDNETIFVEVVVSPPLEKELVNILKDSDSELKPTEIWLIVKDSKTAKALSKLVSNDPRLEEVHAIFQCKLAGDFLDTSKTEAEGRQ